jgi:uncharacterized protein YoxC
MTELITRSGAWLLQQSATLPDTLVMKTVAAERGWFETVTGVASGLMSVTLVVLTIVVAPAAWDFYKTFKKARALLDRVEADINPLTRHASNIADNLDYITTSIRNDVQQVNATIAAANRRLNQAVELTETRMNEFNALLQVVQQEAEQAFVSTASVVRGVRTGAAAFGGSMRRPLDVDGGEDYGDDGESDDTLDPGEDGDHEDERPRGGGAESREPTARPRLRSRQRRHE